MFVFLRVVAWWDEHWWHPCCHLVIFRKSFFGFNFSGKFENSRRVGSTEQYFNFFFVFSFFWFFSWWIGEENTFFLDQLKVFLWFSFFFMISNPLGEIRTNPLELKEEKIKFYCKIKTNQLELHHNFNA